MKFLNVLFLFICLSAFGQSKVGTINIDFVLAKMTEFPAVQESVTAYGKELEGQLETKMKSYEALLKDYNDTQATLGDALKKGKQDAIIASEEDIRKFRQNGAQLVNIRRDELLRPLYQKISVSLEKLAKAQNYTQIMQISDDIVYIDENYDITVAVLADMGVTVTEEDKN